MLWNKIIISKIGICMCTCACLLAGVVLRLLRIFRRAWSPSSSSSSHHCAATRYTPFCCFCLHANMTSLTSTIYANSLSTSFVHTTHSHMHQKHNNSINWLFDKHKCFVCAEVASNHKEWYMKLLISQELTLYLRRASLYLVFLCQI